MGTVLDVEIAGSYGAAVGDIFSVGITVTQKFVDGDFCYEAAANGLIQTSGENANIQYAPLKVLNQFFKVVDLASTLTRVGKDGLASNASAGGDKLPWFYRVLDTVTNQEKEFHESQLLDISEVTGLVANNANWTDPA